MDRCARSSDAPRMEARGSQRFEIQVCISDASCQEVGQQGGPSSLPGDRAHPAFHRGPDWMSRPGEQPALPRGLRGHRPALSHPHEPRGLGAQKQETLTETEGMTAPHRCDPLSLILRQGVRLRTPEAGKGLRRNIRTYL